MQGTRAGADKQVGQAGARLSRHENARSFARLNKSVYACVWDPVLVVGCVVSIQTVPLTRLAGGQG